MNTCRCCKENKCRGTLCAGCKARDRYWDGRPYWRIARYKGHLERRMTRMHFFFPKVEPDANAEEQKKRNGTSARRAQNGRQAAAA